MSRATSEALRFDAVTKRYGALTAVDDISFTVEQGETVGLVGPNGAGKSTLLKSLIGAIRPTAGAVRIRGSRITELPAPGRTVGFVLDPDGLTPGLSVLTALRLEARALGVDRVAVDRALERHGVADLGRRRVGNLSTGQRRRVALAAATLASPGILVLDEPTNGLDIEAVIDLRTHLVARRAEGLTTLVSSHDLGELTRLVDRVVVVNRTVRYDGVLPASSAEEAEAWYLTLVGGVADPVAHPSERSAS
ncbi:ATP-binding cassette domain-containing protein [Agromyces atrinae]|uniref:ABC transporter ATP-binding protein n=1 Tax=Agromyces atrinae TaxID=592376 RepID=UPI001F5A0867|nr:ATP-binding cassette domain-containing protein [Agromyces atrinae]MCI2957676.1 ATP-binding cassette domain-containing protein [Agromyces atrinae]